MSELHMLVGADAIAKELGMSRRQVYSLIYSGALPTIKVGGLQAIRKTKLVEWVSTLEAA